MNKELWTKDFTIITMGSVVSMFGNVLSGFALSLMVLDYTGSTSLYAIYIACYTIPQIFMPVISGAILDRFSRKKAIYTLDFISSGLYAFIAVICSTGIFNYGFLLILAFLIGMIDSIYKVAYQSFYPLLIPKGYYSKAYSIATFIETLSMVVTPLAALIYNTAGIVPLEIINSVSFFTAAFMETKISLKEEYIERRSSEEKKNLFSDIKDGFAYLWKEHGLLAIAVYFTFDAMMYGITSVCILPWFRASYEYGEYIYMIVLGMASLGRVIGSAVLYRHPFPVKHRYTMTLFVYVTSSLLDAFYLYFGIPVMMVFNLIRGLLGTTSYNIRISATQSYVPDERKGRFNGAFSMLNTAGTLCGELIGAAAVSVLPTRTVVTFFLCFNAVVAIIVVGSQKKAISAVYNRET